MTVGERIKQKRIEQGLSQDELAKKVGYKSRSSIQKIELSRNLPLPKVEKMAVALGCTPSYLMGWQETESEQIKMDYLIDLYTHNEQAKQFMELYERATPAIREAVLILLNSSGQDS